MQLRAGGLVTLQERAADIVGVGVGRCCRRSHRARLQSGHALPGPPCRDLFGEAADFLREGLEVVLNFHITTSSDSPVTGEVRRADLPARQPQAMQQGSAEGSRDAGGSSCPSMPAPLWCSSAARACRKCAFMPQHVRMFRRPCFDPLCPTLPPTPEFPLQVPQHVTLAVVEAAPTMKGETAAPSYKRAVVEGGIEVGRRWIAVGGQQGDWYRAYHLPSLLGWTRVPCVPAVEAGGPPWCEL